MAKGRELKGRIKSVENTRKITRTMEMVATSKMKRAQDRVSAARPYAQAVRGEIDALYVIYPNFKSVLSAPPAAVQVLPVQPPEAGAKQRDYILAPDAQSILGELLPLYVRNSIYRALVEMTAAFYAAQRTAMKNATDNATDMLKILGRTYNRARQATITQEIAEIVGGAAALQG